MGQMCEGLISLGHEVSVITSFPHYERFRVWDEYRGKLYERASYRGMDVLRLWVYASGSKQNSLRRLASYLSFNAAATIGGLLQRGAFDVILCPNGSFFTGLSSAIVGAPRRVPFVYNVQDLYPEAPARSGQLRSRSAVAGLKVIERVMYRLATHITVITPSFQEYLVSTKGVPPEKVSVIPNFVDTQFIRPLPKVNDFSRDHGLADKFVVSHSGNVGSVYDLETMLHAAARMTGQKDILFLIVGDGVAKAGLERKAAELGVENVRFLPFQPHEKLPWLRAACDVQVSLYRREQADYSMPSKIYEIMASGRPVLASAEVESDVRRLVDETGCGICIAPENTDELVEAVLGLYRDPARREDMAQRGRETVERRYSKQTVVAQYHELFQRVAKH